jgi:hypothetical protein
MVSSIGNDTEFKQALSSLDIRQQRSVAALFLEHVVALSSDERIVRVIRTARNSNASDEELAAAHKSARAAVIDTHTRCGADADWREQAGYFVARAAAAMVTPQEQCKSGGPAWQAAMSCRMARTCESIDTGADSAGEEREQQYRILTEYLKS